MPAIGASDQNPAEQSEQHQQHAEWRREAVRLAGRLLGRADVAGTNRLDPHRGAADEQLRNAGDVSGDVDAAAGEQLGHIGEFHGLLADPERARDRDRCGAAQADIAAILDAIGEVRRTAERVHRVVERHNDV